MWELKAYIIAGSFDGKKYIMNVGGRPTGNQEKLTST
jgi:hypothetical protein